MKKLYIFLITIIIITIIIYPKIERIISSFNEIDTSDTYKVFTLTFDECNLNTDNFIKVFSFFYNREFEINKIVPYINESNQIIFNNKEFLYYEKDINKVINDFKNKYIDIMVNNDLYVSNVCIKNIVIKSTVGDIREFSTKYKFSYL